MKLLKILKLYKRGNSNFSQAEKKGSPIRESAIGVPKVVDFYQDSIEKIGRDQFKKLVEKGLSIPVFAL